MKIASTGIRLLWLVVDNASQGVKFSRKLGNVILYGSQQREKGQKQTMEAAAIMAV